MTTCSPASHPFRHLGRVLALAGFAFALPALAAAQVHLRSTATSGLFTLLPKQTLRLHLVDVGKLSPTATSARIELRDERGTLLGFRSTTNLRPGAAIHLVLRSTSLLGSRPSLYVRAIAITETEADNLASSPIFSLDAQPEGPDNLTIPVSPPCPMFTMTDPPTPQGSQRDCGGGLLVQILVP